jgi:hypothetical protein
VQQTLGSDFDHQEVDAIITEVSQAASNEDPALQLPKQTCTTSGINLKKVGKEDLLLILKHKLPLSIIPPIKQVSKGWERIPPPIMILNLERLSKEWNSGLNISAKMESGS